VNGWDLELAVVRQGLTNDAERRALARDVERGLKVRLRRGVYASAEEVELLDSAGRAVVHMRALDAVSPERPVFSHWSAVVLHGLPFLVERTSVVEVTDPGRSRAVDGTRLHIIALTDSDVAEVGGLLCTSPARTVIDVAGGAAFGQGVAVADAALHARRVHLGDLDAARRRAGFRRSFKRIDDVLAFADEACESPGESLSRATMHRLGLPTPVLQHTIRDAGGFVARVDFYFPDQHAVGEMDGKAKYVDPKMNKGDPARVVYEEKLREDRVRALGLGVARWGWAEASNPLLLGRRLAAVGVVPVKGARAVGTSQRARAR
jgi:hypothetical protein